jgi:hypothetical protein
MTTKPVDDEIQLLSNADNITLEQIDHYLFQRRTRAEKKQSTTQDFVFGLIAELIVSQENEAVELDPYKGIKVNQPEGLKQELKLIAARLDDLDKRITSPSKEKMPRAEQIAKERVQAIAKYLWNLYPDMTQPEMAAHEAIFNLKITGAKGYTFDTIKKWVAEVDPRAPEKKRGRPRKVKK